jgi:hypothetical protein
MEAVLYIVGALWIVLGTFSILYTDRARRWCATVNGSIPLRVMAFVPVVIGGLLMLSAPWSHSFWLVEALGLLALAKGLLLLFIGRDKAETLVDWWDNRASEVTWRFVGLIGVILGVFLVFRL